jgi:hypothetical protein
MILAVQLNIMFCMPSGKQRTLQKIQKFIRKRLPPKLVRDFKGLRIVKEADVECAAYHHLRRYIGEDPVWRVLARKHVPLTGHFVDLLIFKRYRPVIAVELKWGQLNIGKKDRKSLYGALAKLGVNKAYWLSAVSTQGAHQPLLKEEGERYVLHRIIVRLGLGGHKLQDWKERRKLLRANMARGRGRKLVIKTSGTKRQRG